MKLNCHPDGRFICTVRDRNHTAQKINGTLQKKKHPLPDLSVLNASLLTQFLFVPTTQPNKNVFLENNCIILMEVWMLNNTQN